MKKIYSNNAERQRAFRGRKRLAGFRTVTLMVPDDIYAEIKGKPDTLIDVFKKYRQPEHQFRELADQSLELKDKNSISLSTEYYNKLQITLDSFKAEHERLKAEHIKLQDAYSILKFGDWYSRK